MRPADIGPVFTLDRPAPPADLAHAVDHHWLVQWDLRGAPDYRSEVLTHPSVHLVLEPHGAFVYGVRRELDVRTITGKGYAAGTKFLPGGFGALVQRPVAELTDGVFEVHELFGEDGARLAAETQRHDDLDTKLQLVQDFLRPRLTESTEPERFVRRVVEDMRTGSPARTVEEIAADHGASSRTLQRFFHRHVGVSPKWVLQRYRLHDALENLSKDERPDWSRLALDLGYFDHAHFIRDFRAVVGRSPAEYETSLAA